MLNKYWNNFVLPIVSLSSLEQIAYSTQKLTWDFPRYSGSRRIMKPLRRRVYFCWNEILAEIHRWVVSTSRNWISTSRILFFFWFPKYWSLICWEFFRIVWKFFAKCINLLFIFRRARILDPATFPREIQDRNLNASKHAKSLSTDIFNSQILFWYES